MSKDFRLFSEPQCTCMDCLSEFLILLACVIQTVIVWLKNEKPTWCHLLFYFTSYVLNMFRTLIYPPSGACDCIFDLPHRSFCSQFVVCWRFGVAGFGWSTTCASACKTNNTKYQPQQKLQYTMNWEQDDQCDNSSTQSQAPEDGYINVRNMLNT